MKERLDGSKLYSGEEMKNRAINKIREKTAKGKTGILKVVFGRTAVILFAVVIQLFLLLYFTFKLTEYSAIFYGFTTVLTAFLVVYIINKNENSAFKMAWLVLILVFPVFGALFYLFVQLQLSSKLLNAKYKKLSGEMSSYVQQESEIQKELEEEDMTMANLASYMKKFGGYPVYKNTETVYHSCGEEAFPQIMEELQKAKKYIFLEFFIVHDGRMWSEILATLIEKANAGVEVRVMFDGTCSVFHLPYNYPKILKEYGISCRFFSPIRPVLSTHQNNRDHRKILVVDGHTAFTGGYNLSDEYINELPRFGYWKDTGVMLKGEAVKAFTHMFLQLWNLQGTTEDDIDKYLLEKPEAKNSEGNGFVIPYTDSPFDGESVGQAVYIDMLYTAKKYVHIMTPYLIIDNETKQALTYAAKRGVEVIIIMPHIPDKAYAFVVAKTYYQELMAAGVQIYEFLPGFIHAKGFVSDDIKSIVGTINLDYRSLYLHFECAVYHYKDKVVNDVEDDFQSTLSKSRLVTEEDCKKDKWYRQLAGRILRIFAPLM